MLSLIGSGQEARIEADLNTSVVDCQQSRVTSQYSDWLTSYILFVLSISTHRLHVVLATHVHTVSQVFGCQEQLTSQLIWCKQHALVVILRRMSVTMECHVNKHWYRRLTFLFTVITQCYLCCLDVN